MAEDKKTDEPVPAAPTGQAAPTTEAAPTAATAAPATEAAPAAATAAPATEAAPAAAAAAPATRSHVDLVVEAPFVDDIVIWTENLDVPRVLTQDALRQLPKLGSSLLPPINSLIKQGVTIAAIPTTSGIGASCYLVNLATLKKPDGPK